MSPQLKIALVFSALNAFSALQRRRCDRTSTTNRHVANFWHLALGCRS